MKTIAEAMSEIPELEVIGFKPWSREQPPTLESLAAALSAERAAQAAAPDPDPERAIEPPPGPLRADELGEPPEGAWVQPVARTEASPAPHPRLWQPQPSDRFTVAELDEPPPPPRFTLWPYVPEGVPCLLQGAGGTSKTGLLAALAVGICTGRSMLGDVRAPGSVLIVSAEDRRDAIRRHLYSATRGRTPAELDMVAERLVIKDAVGLGVKLTRSVASELRISGDVSALCDFARTIPDLRLVVLDTLSRLHGGEETNEGLAAFVEAMEAICRRTRAATIAAHHTGKAQARSDMADQYGGRGGSALSDNCRSVMHLSAVTPETKGAPTNAADLIDEGRLVRLSLVKCNAIARSLVPDVYLERVVTEGAAQLRVFDAELGRPGIAATWGRIEAWMRDVGCSIAFPSQRAMAAEAQGAIPRLTRAQVRDAITWAIECGRLVEAPHPSPKGALKTFVRLAPTADYEAVTRGN